MLMLSGGGGGYWALALAISPETASTRNLSVYADSVSWGLGLGTHTRMSILWKCEMHSRQQQNVMQQQGQERGRKRQGRQPKQREQQRASQLVIGEAVD